MSLRLIDVIARFRNRQMLPLEELQLELWAQHMLQEQCSIQLVQVQSSMQVLLHKLHMGTCTLHMDTYNMTLLKWYFLTSARFL